MSEEKWFAGLNRDHVDEVTYEPEPSYLAEKNPVPEFDEDFTFDEPTHKYTSRGRVCDMSVTSFIKVPFDEFKEDETIARMLSKSQWANDPSYKYYKMERHTIKGDWERNRDEAAKHGTLMHKCIELYYNKTSLFHRKPHLEPFNMPSVQIFRKFHEEVVRGKYEPFRTELRVIDRSPVVIGRQGLAAPSYLPGSVDMIFRHANRPADGSLDNHIVVMDWKRSKNVKTEGFRGRMCKPPFDKVGDCKLGQFQMQLNTYRYIIERNTHYVVDSLHCVVFHPINGDYKKYDIPFLGAEVQELFRMRIQKSYSDEMANVQESIARLRVMDSMLNRSNKENNPFFKAKRKASPKRPAPKRTDGSEELKKPHLDDAGDKTI